MSLTTIATNRNNQSSQSDRIVNAFDRAAETYNQSCDVQRRIADHLAARIVDWHARMEQVLELGCGTGTLTRLLAERFPESRIMATDASPAMIAIAQEQIAASNVQFQTFFVGKEMELGDLDCSVGRFNLVASNMALHWVDGLEDTLLRIASKADQIAFSIPLSGTFGEWISAHDKLGLRHGVRDFVTEETVLGWNKTLFSVHELSLEVRNFQESFEDPIEFVRRLRQVGAAQPRAGHLPVNNLRSVLKQFPDGLTINYRIAFVHATRI